MFRAGIVGLFLAVSALFSFGAYAACADGDDYHPDGTSAYNHYVACGTYSGAGDRTDASGHTWTGWKSVWAVNGVWHSLNHWFPGGINPLVCASGQNINTSNGTCYVAPPPVDCSKEKGNTESRVLSQANASNYCFGVIQIVDPTKPWDTSHPENYSEGKCAVVLDPSAGAMMHNMSTGEVEGVFTFTGETCSTGATANPSVPSTPTAQAPQQSCITGASGTVACVSAKNTPNCGTFNGKEICVDSPPAGNCTFAGSGNWACSSTASSPPKPTVPPELSMDGHAKNGATDTLLIFPPGAQGGDANSTYTAGGSTGGTGTGCGTASNPCKIDETGTPTASYSDFASANGTLDSAVTDAQGEGANGSQGDGSTVASGARGAIDSALPSGGDCSPLTMSLPGGRQVVIDLADKCSDFRAALAWMLGIATAWFVLDLIFRKPV